MYDYHLEASTEIIKFLATDNKGHNKLNITDSEFINNFIKSNCNAKIQILIISLKNLLEIFYREF